MNLFKTKIYFEFIPSLFHQMAKRGVICCDRNIANSHGQKIQKALGYELLEIPSGEEHKTRATKEWLEDALFERRIGKEDLLIALGGGTTTDLVGFVASTYMRGLPLVLFPTTLLAMVDAAIGGKTGVNTRFGKNSVGTFYLPDAVVIDPHFLSTLPPREIKNGYSEILKYGLIQNRKIWDLGTEDLLPLIRACIACKIEVVVRDFEEKKGLRRILNFGHTIGHALELRSHFKMPHGEAVALGCMAESILSHLLGYLSLKDLEKILEKYHQFGYCLHPLKWDNFYEDLLLDKKGKEGMPRSVMIDRIGHCVPFEGEYCSSLTKRDIDRLVAWIQNEKG